LWVVKGAIDDSAFYLGGAKNVISPRLSLANARTGKRLAFRLVLSATILITGASICLAQIEGPSAIRVEAQQVVVPVFVVDKSDVRKDWRHTKYEEWDKEVTGLAAKNFQVFEDGKEQEIRDVTIDLPRVWQVSDNISQHTESACTPRGIWAGPDFPKQRDSGGSALWLLHVYLISYTPPPSPPGRPCHQIKVKVDRRGATVYARDAYCNTQNELYDAVDGTKLGRQMDSYADSTQEGKFPVSVQASSFFGDSSANRVNVAVEFPSNELWRKWNDVKLDATIAVLGMVYNSDHALAARFSDIACHPSILGDAYRGSFPMPGADRKFYERQVIPSHYDTELDLPSGNYVLKLVVTDGKKFGRVEVPLSVESFAQDSLAISGIVLCKRFHKVPEPLAQEARAPQYVPLVTNGLEFTPAGDTRFQKKDGLVSYFQIREPLLKGTDPVKLQVQLRVRDAKTGELKSQTRLLPVESASRPQNSIVPVAEKLALDKLPSGRYRLEIQASNSVGKSSVWSSAAFSVE
jgi:hypothetical protein